MMTSSILTRKFRLHWVQNPRENQIHLHQFFQEYIKKANRLIAYIFSLQAQLNATDPTQFQQLFRKTGKTAYNDFYTYGLDLKRYNREITAGRQFKQRTMRMLCNDVYYAIRNFLIRHHNLKQILMILLQSPKSINWDRFVRKGRLSQRTYRQLKLHLRKDCYDEQQIFSQVLLTNHLRQLRNLVLNQITHPIKAMW